MSEIEKISINFENEPKLGVFTVTDLSDGTGHVSNLIASIKENFTFKGYTVYVGIKKGANADSVKVLKKAYGKDKSVKFVSLKKDKLTQNLNAMVKSSSEDGNQVLCFCGENMKFMNDVPALMSYVIIENQGKVGAVGCRIMNEGSEKVFNAGLFVTDNNEFGYINGDLEFDKESLDGKNLFRVPGVDHKMMFIMNTVFDSVQGFNPETEDMYAGIELSLRLVSLGKENYVATDGVCEISPIGEVG